MASRQSGSAPPPSSPSPSLTQLRPAARVSRLIKQALADLPPEYAKHLDNVVVVLRRSPAPALRERRRHGSLYGLYEGIPLTHRDTNYSNVTPDRITIFWGALTRDFPDDGTLETEVRNTVYHELGHYFGLDEDDLHHTRVR